jgi:phosphoribosylformylglycinamidine synthase PurS subunit
MKIGIKIMPREVILDSQGRAVEQSMRTNGFTEVQECRIGKYVELSLSTEDKSLAQAQVEKMLKEGGLYNPLIEKFEIQLN